MAESISLSGAASRLAEAVCGILAETRGLAYRGDEVGPSLRASGRPGHGFPMRVGIRFHGRREGEYALFLQEETAARLAGRWAAGQGLDALQAARADSESFVMELMNAAVGEALYDLERAVKGLEFMPASVAWDGGSGPEAPWGEALVIGDAGPLLCCFLLNPAGAAGSAAG